MEEKMEPDKIESKRLRLVGVEMCVHLEKDFSSKLYALRAEIRARLDEIQNRINNRHVGFWQWQFADTSDSLFRNYFCGVEVSEFRDIPYGMVIRNLPEKNGEEGTVTEKNGVYANWLPLEE